MSDFSDDDTGLWEDQYSEPTIQIAPIRRRTTERTRSHHVVEGDRGHRTQDDARDSRYDDERSAHDTIWLEPVRRTRRAPDRSRRRGGLLGSIDPRLLSVGAAALAAVLAVPLFGALSGGGEENDSFLSVAEAETTTTTVVAPAAAPPSSVVVITAALNPVADDSGNASSHGVGDASASASSGNSDSDTSSGSGDESAGGSSGGASGGRSGTAGSGVLPAPTERSAAQCGNPYEVQAGDFWIALADAVGMSLDDFLAYNEVTVDTPLYVGSIVCLPLGTSVTSSTLAPVTAAPTTVPAATVITEPATAPATTPATTATPQTDAPTTPAPPAETATTAAPATTTPPADDDDDDDGGGGIPLPSGPVPSGGEVEQMIRDIWPDDLEEQALRIAWRESGFRPDVTSPTGCCHGVFQLHWFAHGSWLSDLGITSRDQLFDARTNIQAAYALYQRSGWGPWQ